MLKKEVRAEDATAKQLVKAEKKRRKEQIEAALYDVLGVVRAMVDKRYFVPDNNFEALDALEKALDNYDALTGEK